MYLVSFITKKFPLYFQLIKPEIIRGNLITAAAGFVLASHQGVDFALLATMLIALFCIIGSACAVNNYWDRDIDRKMHRTASRAFAQNLISTGEGLGLAAILFGTGCALFAFNGLMTSLFFAVIGWIIYVGVYTPLKRKTPYATEIGSLSGSAPVLVGYTAVSADIGIDGWIFWVSMILWQMPHFFSIALYRMEEYKAAHIPVLPLTVSLQAVQKKILIYIVLLTLVSSSLCFAGGLKPIYTAIYLAFCIGWIKLAAQGFQTTDMKEWAKRMFFFSISIMTLLNIFIFLSA